MAQNLIPNSSFEKFRNCPDALGTFGDEVTSWSSPSLGSTDYFHTCSTVMGAPENFNGEQEPKFGEAYAGFYFYAPADYREYVQVRLKEPLKKGNTYELQFYASLAEGSDFAIREFGALLTDKPLKLKTRKNISRTNLFNHDVRFRLIEVTGPKYHKNKTNWIQFTTKIRAKGFETHLILGNFQNNAGTKRLQTKRHPRKRGAYYYLDMVTLKDTESKEIKESPILKDSLYVFKEVYFDFDRFKFQKKAEQELMAIQTVLEHNPNLHIEIHGHTDDLGSESYNRMLSEKRAKTIATFFMDVGIEENRIHWYGHGYTKPILNNTSSEGRAKNRRVEFLITKGN